MSRRHSLAAAAVFAVMLASAGPALAAEADDMPVVDAGGILSFEVDQSGADGALEPGETRFWAIAPVLAAPGAARLSMRVFSEGELADTADGLQLAFRECAVPWQLGATESGGQPHCPTGDTAVLDAPFSAIGNEDTIALGTIDPGTGPYYLAAIGLPAATSNSTNAASATIGFSFDAMEAAASIVLPIGTGQPGRLATTGIDLVAPLALASGILALGFALVLNRRRPASS
jgi:hypothetical protein